MKLTKREKVAITIAAIWMLTAFLVGGALGASTHTCDPLPACTAEECKPFAACVDEKAALGACRGDKAATVERIERRLTDMEAICRARGTSCPQPYVEGDAGMSVGVARGVPLGHTEPTWIVSCKQLEHGCEPERCPPCDRPHVIEAAPTPLFDWSRLGVGMTLRLDDEIEAVDGIALMGRYYINERWSVAAGPMWTRSHGEYRDRRCWLAKSEVNAYCHRDEVTRRVEVDDVQAVVNVEWKW